MDHSISTLNKLLNDLNFHLIGKCCDQKSVVKVNSYNLSKNGELCFQINLKAWKCFDHKLECEQGCTNIIEHSLFIQKELSNDIKVDHIIEKVKKI